MKDKFFCDSNILLYAFGNQDLKKKEIASKILLDERCVISVQVINEVSNIMIKKLKFSNSQIDQFIHSCYKRYLIVALDEAVFIKACNIRENYNISYYDSLIVSSAVSASCSILYSEDMHHNLKIDLLTIKNPFEKGI
ncbi:MAG: PIN domain-containing protein [Campylobacterota bacterium]|nr:PIN domain-containing protein [Campylobacterota bacterium]